MAGLPENGVKVVEFADLFRSADLGEMRSAVELVADAVDTHPGSITPIPVAVRQRVDEVVAARRRLLDLLGHRAVVRDATALRRAYDEVNNRRFRAARDLIADIDRHPDLPPVTGPDVELACSAAITMQAFIPGPLDAEGEPTAVRVTRTLCRAYDGPKPAPADIVALRGFLRSGAERKLLLDGECLLGLGGPAHLASAIHQYATLLPPAVTTAVDVFGADVRLFQRYRQRRTGGQVVAMPGIVVTWTGPLRDITPTQQFVALRSAFAHLELADALRRRRRVVSRADRDRLAAVYDTAARLVRESAISPQNAQRGRIETHAARQRRSLRAGLNALGLREGFVPAVRFSALADEASTAVTELAQSAAEALSSLRAAEDLIGEELPLLAELDEEELRTGIYLSKIDIAGFEEEKADSQVALIRDQQRALLAQTAAGIFGSIAKATTNPAEAFAGVVQQGVGFLAQRNELGHQLDMAELDVDITRVQTGIAETEALISQRRAEHLQQRLHFLRDRRVDADLYLTLAELHEKRAARLLDAAILLAYLAERALAFARAAEIPPLIRFDYWDDPDPDAIPRPELLSAEERRQAATIALRNDVNDLRRLELTTADESLRVFQEHISLGTEYPLEFARLLQDGEMHFEYSLYQLSKRFPFAYKCRLYDVAVQVDAVAPVGGPRGLLEHSGSFLLRQRGVDGVTRLLPTDAELAAAVARQREEGGGMVAVGGVLSYLLEPDPLVSTVNSPLISANVPGDLLPAQLRRALEGYGPTGLWRFELHNLDELFVTDVIVHFGIVAGVDTQVLEPRIEQLVREYERELSPGGEPLDKITRCSLRELDLFTDLRTGVATVRLDRDAFPDGLSDLRFKAVVAQALDDGGRGVEGVALRVGKPDSAFVRERSTVRGGFSEDLDAELEILPIADRFPIEGPWQVELLDPAGAFPLLDDLRLFFLYSFG